MDSKEPTTDAVVLFLEREIAQVQNSRYGEEERRSPGITASLYQALERRKKKEIAHQPVPSEANNA
jgi:hypothetical protein